MKNEHIHSKQLKCTIVLKTVEISTRDIQTEFYLKGEIINMRKQEQQFLHSSTDISMLMKLTQL